MTPDQRRELHTLRAKAAIESADARRAMQAQSVEGEPSRLAELVRQGRIPGHEPDDMFNGFA